MCSRIPTPIRIHRERERGGREEDTDGKRGKETELAKEESKYPTKLCIRIYIANTVMQRVY